MAIIEKNGSGLQKRGAKKRDNPDSIDKYRLIRAWYLLFSKAVFPRYMLL